MVIKTNHFPNPGETVLGGQFYMNLGGKGANQAVAAARLGADVHFVTCVGDDLFGMEAVKQLRTENVQIFPMKPKQETHSGVALITIDKTGENNIVVASGANLKLDFEDTSLLEQLITEDSIVLVQLEIPIETILQVCTFAKGRGALLVLNPAPICPLPEEILSLVDIITPNQVEAKGLSGITVTDSASATLAAAKIHDMGPEHIIITMGDKGAVLFSSGEMISISGHPVDAVDTTAAGDVFNGALTMGLAKGNDILSSMTLANKAAAIAVTRIGAQSSAPTMDELDTFFKQPVLK